jgi:hypothetical protein
MDSSTVDGAVPKSNRPSVRLPGGTDFGSDLFSAVRPAEFVERSVEGPPTAPRSQAELRAPFLPANVRCVGWVLNVLGADGGRRSGDVGLRGHTASFPERLLTPVRTLRRGSKFKRGDGSDVSPSTERRSALCTFKLVPGKTGGSASDCVDAHRGRRSQTVGDPLPGAQSASAAGGCPCLGRIRPREFSAATAACDLAARPRHPRDH